MLVNPIAAGGRAAVLWRRHESRLRANYPELSVHFTAAPGDAEACVRHWQGGATDVVLVVGGDGTIHEVVNGLLEGGGAAALAVVPAGSGNDFARNLGLPLEPARALARLANARVRRIDVGRGAGRDLAGEPWRRCFVNSLSLGLSERANRIAARLRALPGRLRYPVAGALALLRSATLAYELTQGGALLQRGRALNLTFANGACFGAGLCISPASEPDDGVLDLVTIGPVGRWRALAALARLRLGGRLGLPEVAVLPLHGPVCLKPGDAPYRVELDGERLLARGELSIELLPGRLPVLC